MDDMEEAKQLMEEAEEEAKQLMEEPKQLASVADRVHVVSMHSRTLRVYH